MSGRFLTDPKPKPKSIDHYCWGVEHAGKVPNGTIWVCDDCRSVWRFSYMEFFRSWGWKKLSLRKGRKAYDRYSIRDDGYLIDERYLDPNDPKFVGNQ